MLSKKCLLVEPKADGTPNAGAADVGAELNEKFENPAEMQKFRRRLLQIHEFNCFFNSY